MPNTHKLYCYIDESGQDTKGQFFIVAAVVTGDELRELEAYLESLESLTGKKTKWMKTSDKIRQAYISALIRRPPLCTVFTKTFRGYKTGFDELEVLAAAQALNVYRSRHEINDNAYKVTIVVDGLSRTVATRMGSEFRKLGIKTRKIVGKKDESSSIIRLADAIAGLTREAQEDRPQYKKLLAKLKAKQTLKEL